MKNLFIFLKKVIVHIYTYVYYAIYKKSKIYSIDVSRKIQIGHNVIIGKKTQICDNVEIGDYTYINSNFNYTTIDTNVSIGKFCSIGPAVTIALGDHNIYNISTHPFLYNKKYGFINKLQDKYGIIDENKKTVIGNDVWIGANSNIKRGIVIGDGAVIGMNSVVTKDVPPYAVVVGVPAKVIKYRFKKDEIEYLEKNRWWDCGKEELMSMLDELYDINKYYKK